MIFLKINQEKIQKQIRQYLDSIGNDYIPNDELAFNITEIIFMKENLAHKRRIENKDKIICVAETYANMKGSFTINELYDFFLNSKNNFNIGSDFSKKKLGNIIGANKKFKKISTEMTQNKRSQTSKYILNDNY